MRHSASACPGAGGLGLRVARHANRSAYSDLDLATITHHPLPFEVSGAMTEDFSESDLPFRVDILDWATTQDNFRRIVERDKVILQSPTQ